MVRSTYIMSNEGESARENKTYAEKGIVKYAKGMLFFITPLALLVSARGYAEA